MESRVILRNSDLTSLGVPRGFGPRFGLAQRVEIFFSSDKAGPAWRNEPESTHGFLESHSFVDRGRADATVYVYAPTPESAKVSNRISPLSMNIGDPKEDALRGLVHELIHVQQAWMSDPYFDKDYTAKGLYSSNRFEKQAYRDAEIFINSNRARIKNGFFDKYLPPWILQAVRK